jgi:hypothetical protein
VEGNNYECILSMTIVLIVVYVWTRRSCTCACTSRTEVGSSQLLGIIGQRWAADVPTDICDPMRRDIEEENSRGRRAYGYM